ncbi:hypothetical protein CONLIGDRAFT_645275 [Coniochaeta ligniaria NRRL 30616]|uniref:Uncharacterized protein n=1 Tax=Coniochaeta ligniaria NRRL 30616 TaxID=1408157 RepID=A0A1J7JIN0_9PEZI|nr:hypothetical protein CONLIGDRAFT_645275 [Coniochaeta ligniaria NRRL 30616]
MASSVRMRLHASLTQGEWMTTVADTDGKKGMRSDLINLCNVSATIQAYRGLNHTGHDAASVAAGKSACVRTDDRWQIKCAAVHVDADRNVLQTRHELYVFLSQVPKPHHAFPGMAEWYRSCWHMGVIMVRMNKRPTYWRGSGVENMHMGLHSTSAMHVCLVSGGIAGGSVAGRGCILAEGIKTDEAVRPVFKAH